MPEEYNSSFRPRHLLFIWAFSCFFIPFLSLTGRRLQYWVYGHIGEALIGWLIGLILLGLGGAAFYWLVKWHLRDRRNILILISILLAVLFIAINFQLPQPEERLHFVTFGIFGFSSWRLLNPVLAIVSVIAMSCGDEIFQAWLPDRVGDLRDVGFNIMASMIGIVLARLGEDKSSRMTHR